jgi:hypothetical protein
MYIQYINKGQHQFRDNGIDINMGEGEIKDVTENTGRFLTSRFKHSFIVASAPQEVKKIFANTQISK